MVDIYGERAFCPSRASVYGRTGYDNYPNGFDCTNPYDWKASAVPEFVSTLFHLLTILIFVQSALG